MTLERISASVYNARGRRKRHALMDDVVVDIMRTAKIYIEKHGDKAEIVAARLADDLLAKGEMEEHAILLKVVLKIRELENSGEGQVLH